MTPAVVPDCTCLLKTLETFYKGIVSWNVLIEKVTWFDSQGSKVKRQHCVSFGAILLLLAVSYAFCKALSLKSLWIKASAK